MITIEIFEAVSFYKRLTEEVKQGSLNPFEISTEDLKELVGENIYHNGLIISLLSKLIKLKAEYLEKQLIPQTKEEKQETIKSVFKQVLQEEIGIEEDDIEALLMVDSIRKKLKKPKSVKPKKISYQEFQEITKSQIKEVLYEDVDYNIFAKQIYEKIKKEIFTIRSYKDFIGLMFAINIYNLTITDIKLFLKEK